MKKGVGQNPYTFIYQYVFILEDYLYAFLAVQSWNTCEILLLNVNAIIGWAIAL